MSALPSPKERFDYACKHAAVLRALLSHPAMHLTPEGLPDRVKTPPTLFFVTDFGLRTYNDYLLPILPPDAEKTSQSLALQAVDEVKESPELMSDDMYPRMEVGGFRQKWVDAQGRTMMFKSCILNTARHQFFGGSFDFGDEVNEKARALA
ncbi:hypothetical protein Z517_05090 [Fonsecaea pedrosoi CBS 271.37]|uniref:Uncharacterized protein n=1 Tax=Fonsecaea pedrosoi CBS 271.37 TaxID=1442368 RepID=A0A0D2GMA0_9EURO|nr:uncharacterized protein Z517_05090 [Fonsecaea pedrosoi CBS 271.37]KIW82063.1 hypothetical protein Z517_05090 [Fonsecaea pedrosoi CBS 271.37]